MASRSAASPAPTALRSQAGTPTKPPQGISRTPQGQTAGYLRVSSIGQNDARQLEGVALDRTFTDTASGKDTERPQLQAMLEFVRAGDTVRVHSMDRLSRSLRDLEGVVKELTGRGVTVAFSSPALVFKGGSADPMAMLMLQVMGAVAQFERSLILERQREGIAIAKADGVYKGRKPSLDGAGIAKLRALLAGGMSKAQAAKELRISRATLYARIAEGA